MQQIFLYVSGVVVVILASVMLYSIVRNPITSGLDCIHPSPYATDRPSQRPPTPHTLAKQGKRDIAARPHDVSQRETAENISDTVVEPPRAIECFGREEDGEEQKMSGKPIEDIVMLCIVVLAIIFLLFSFYFEVCYKFVCARNASVN